MKLETRLAILFGVLIAVFVGALSIIHLAQRTSTMEVQSAIGADKTRQLERVIELTGAPLERFVADYTQWDEMVGFVASHDPDWAEINIAQSLDNWGFQTAWVIDAEQRCIYHIAKPPFRDADLAPFLSPPLRAYLCRTEPLHFFADSAQGLLEIRSAPIHPSDDSRRTEPPQGWFVVGKLWDSSTLNQLGHITESTVLVAPAVADVARSPSRSAMIEQSIPIRDWTGTEIHRLRLRHESPLLANMIRYDADEVVLFLTFGVSMLAAATWFLHRWVRRPVRLIEASLSGEWDTEVHVLEKNRDEFARIATLIRTAAVQRLSLRREIEDRTFAEHELRRAIVERAKLGRDLHDGVIQSIYAVGMTLQGVGPIVSRDPDEARGRLDSCVEALNRTIGQLRDHIAGLEKEIGGAPSLAEGLHKLVKEMRSARDIEYSIRVDPLLDQAIPKDSIVQLLFIAREAVSNALRHANARHITLHLGTVQGEAAFSVEDDGRGFEPQQGVRGHGLDNMTRRAEEIGASLTIESVLGRGTRLRVELPWEMLGGNDQAPVHP